MKNIFYILLLLPTIIFAQYQGNANQKITLGEQTTADGLVWRGRLADTSNLLTNKLDTSVYIVLDTGTRAMWYYQASTTPKWTRLVDSLNNLQGQLSLTSKVTGVLPVANGGTNLSTFTAANRVPFSSSSSQLTTASNLTFINSGNRTFQVTASNNNEVALFKTLNAASQSFEVGIWGSTTGAFGAIANSNAYTYGSTDFATVVANDAGSIKWGVGTSATERMRLNTTGLGIGTTSPSGVLEVAGTSANTDFRISRTVSSSTYFYIKAPGGSPSTSTMGVNGVDVMVLNASGNVGIGTASPTYKLDVNGTSRFSNTLSVASNANEGTIEFGTGTFKGVLDYSASTGLYKFNNQTAGGGTTDYYQFQADGTSVFNIKKSGAATFSSSVTANSLSLTTPLSVANGGTGQNTLALNKVMVGNGTSGVLTPTNLHWDNTNSMLGIGTSSPGYYVHLKNPLPIQLFMEGTSTTTHAAMYFTNTRSTTFTSYGGFLYGGINQTDTIFGLTRNDKLFLFADGSDNLGMIVGTLKNQPLYFGTNNLERLRITANGNVGIGTTSPVANLQINSSTTTPTMAFSQSFSNTSAQRGGFAFYNSNISTVASIIAQAVTDNVGTDLEFYTRPVGGLLTKNMVILNNGNVGIGTASPTARLHVKSSGVDGNTTALKVDNNGNVNLLTILDNGNVGVGVTNPILYKFEIESNITGASTLRLNNNNTGGALILTKGSTQIMFNGSADSWVGTGTTNDAGLGAYSGGIRFFTNNSTATRLTISATGLVGIGRTPTTNILEINGDASKTTLGQWLANSDSTIKTEIHTIDGALDRINKIRLVSFKYKNEYKLLNPSIKDKFYQSVIAQEFQKIYPDYVYQSGTIFEGKNILQVDTNPMYIDAIASIQQLSLLAQELQSQIDTLKQEIINLKNK